LWSNKNGKRVRGFKKTAARRAMDTISTVTVTQFVLGPPLLDESMGATKTRKIVHLNVIIERPGGWTPSGQVAMTYDENISGEFETISPLHYYNWRVGRDIYPTKDQVECLLKGETVRGVKWA
jgi:hypothetical protein